MRLRGVREQRLKHTFAKAYHENWRAPGGTAARITPDAISQSCIFLAAQIICIARPAFLFAKCTRGRETIKLMQEKCIGARRKSTLWRGVAAVNVYF